MTVTEKVQFAAFPLASVAVTVTIVVPTGKNEPEAGLLITVKLFVQESVAVGLKFTIAPHSPGSLLRMILAGQTKEGGQMKFSPDGTKLALVNHTPMFLGLYQFNMTGCQDLFISTDSGQCSAVVNYNIGFSDNCNIPL